jgi:hypothetical protein
MIRISMIYASNQPSISTNAPPTSIVVLISEIALCMRISRRAAALGP